MRKSKAEVSRRKTLEKVMGKRVLASKQARERAVKDGDTYVKYITGEARLGEKADRLGVSAGWQRTAVPLHGKLYQTLLPAILARFPKWGYRMSQNAKPLAEERAKVYTRLLDYSWRECDLQQEMRFVTGEAMPYGLAVAEIGIDAERDVPSITWHQTRRVLFDSDCREEPNMKLHRWVGIELTMPIATATERFSGHKFTPIAAGDIVDDDDSPLNDDAVESVQQARVLKVYMRGDNPFTEDANLKSKTKVGKKVSPDADPANIEANDEESVYDGSNRIVWFEYKGDGKVAYLKEEPWPFVLDHDEFPIEVLKLTLDTRNFYPYSIFAPTHSLQVQANWGFTRGNTKLHRTAQTKYIVNEGVFTADEEAKLTSLQEASLVKTKTDASYAKQSIQSLNFVDQSAIAALNQNAGTSASAYHEYSGLDDIALEAKSHQTATTSALQDKKAEVRIAFYADQVERFVARCGRKMIQIAVSTLSVEDVEAVLGPLPEVEVMRLEVPMVAEDGTPQLDEMGQPIMEVKEVRTASVWPSDIKPDEIRREVDIIVEPRSMRFVNSEQNVNELKQIGDEQMAVIAQAMNAAQTNPAAAALILRSGMEMVRQMAEALQLPEVDKFLISPEEAREAFQMGGGIQDQLAQMQQALGEIGQKVQEHDEELAQQTAAQIEQMQQQAAPLQAMP